MKRAEQIEQAAKRYVKDIVTPLPASLMTAFIKGAEYADEHPINYDGKAMLYVLNKGHEQGWKDATRKATEFIEKFAYNSVVTDNIGEREKQAIITTFKEFMEENK